MNRGRKIVILSHCILNQNSVVLPYGKNSIEFSNFINECLLKNIGIIQLPCPEIQIYGLKRWGHVKDQFEHQHFKKESEKMLTAIVSQIKDYKINGYIIEGVYGIKCSPSCGVKKTCRSNWAGEAGSYESIDDINSRVKIVDESGVFIEVFKELLLKENIKLKFEDIDDWGGNFD